MSEISKLIIPGNTIPYDLRDDYAREKINNNHLFVVSPLRTGIVNAYALLGRDVEPYEGLMLHILCSNDQDDSIAPASIRLEENEPIIPIDYANSTCRPINNKIYSFILHQVPAKGTTPAYWNFYPMDDTLMSNNELLGNCYGTCTTEASTTAKIANVNGTYRGNSGYVAIKFTNAVPANSTLNINNTGAKNIYYRGSNIAANIIKAGDTALFFKYSTTYELIAIDRWGADFSSCIKDSDSPITASLTCSDIVDGASVSCNMDLYEIASVIDSQLKLNFVLNNSIMLYCDDIIAGTFVKLHTIYETSGGKNLLTITLDTSVSSTSSGTLTLSSLGDNKQSTYMTTTLTISTEDWTLERSDASCTKSVIGMTATALVWIEFSDTETDFTVTQTTNALTFTTNSIPSETITVNVAWLV